MPALRVECALPEGIVLPSGDYGQEGRSPLKLHSLKETLALTLIPNLSPPFVGYRRRMISMAVEAAEGMDEERKAAFRSDSAQRLLRRLNLLIRWYRAEMQATAIREMTLAQAGP